MERIEDKQKRHVTFSKRRNDLFKKVEEICSLTRATIVIICFSEAGNPFTFCHPSSADNHQQFLRQYYGSSSGCTITAASFQSAPWVKPNRLEKLCPSQVGRRKSARNEVATSVAKHAREVDGSPGAGPCPINGGRPG
ncbi:agamous-like MADS-box protein AGL29 [Nymphaea colorata]|uniref:agamous-like MADS-box protein AGL29 n=1 Tax=Nymphaea colorata TaxID=210225 RepID=UPI00129D51AF|nr:agamous-like MADS-box protein AGL29 [Nymphaea colorata]